MLGWQTIDQRLGLGDIVALPGREDQADWVAQSIDGGVQLGGQAAARAADRTIFKPPFLPVAC
jgi:hypothetical protein